MIPKIIHYCWFGCKEIPALQRECIASWQKYLPDYQLMLWNEENFCIKDYPFAARAYQEQKYAFVSDVCRLVVLEQWGGIYLDTDVELLGTLNPFLKHTAFIGFEDYTKLQTGLIGSEKGGKWITELLHIYQEKQFVNLDGSYNLTTNVDLISAEMEKRGIVLQNQYLSIESYVTLYPLDYFCAKSHIDGSIIKTLHTVAVHHFAGSWLENKDRRARNVRQFLRRVLGTEMYFKIKTIIKR
ncbi:MAG: glycosyl transferase [Flavobacteriaceae bacterium]|jgi:hypothetical protein|nr:glycosyl transferase [Flavobacteriaceae bacterium]